MKFSKEEKGFVIWWIDRQFADNPLFPASCIVEAKEGKSGVSKDHVKAYKAWRKTAPKRAQIQEWIDKWLTKAERKTLKAALDKRTADERDDAPELQPEAAVASEQGTTVPAPEADSAAADDTATGTTPA